MLAMKPEKYGMMYIDTAEEAVWHVTVITGTLLVDSSLADCFLILAVNTLS